MHPKLIQAKNQFEQSGLEFALMHDEPEVSTYFVPRHQSKLVRDYVDEYHHQYKQSGIDLEIRKIRGGMLLTLAIKALNELNIPMGRLNMMYKKKLEDIFNKPLVETQMHSATAGMFRANQSTRRRQAYNSNKTHSGNAHPASPEKTEQLKTVAEQINEALEGIATPYEAQPDELFQNLLGSMDALGNKLGVGSIRQKLAQKGIQYKKSKDNTAVIFYVINASTKAPQPIARVTAEQLAKPHDFENTLLSLLDMSRGDAPGALKQQQELLRSQEQAVRDVAKNVMPAPTEEATA